MPTLKYPGTEFKTIDLGLYSCRSNMVHRALGLHYVATPTIIVHHKAGFTRMHAGCIATMASQSAFEIRFLLITNEVVYPFPAVWMYLFSVELRSLRNFTANSQVWIWNITFVCMSQSAKNYENWQIVGQNTVRTIDYTATKTTIAANCLLTPRYYCTTP